MCVLQTALAQRNQELQVMVDQAASRPQTGHADSTAPFMRVDLREETVTEKAQPGSPQLLPRIPPLLGTLMPCLTVMPSSCAAMQLSHKPPSSTPAPGSCLVPTGRSFACDEA